MVRSDLAEIRVENVSAVSGASEVLQIQSHVMRKQSTVRISAG